MKSVQTRWVPLYLALVVSIAGLAHELLDSESHDLLLDSECLTCQVYSSDFMDVTESHLFSPVRLTDEFLWLHQMRVNADLKLPRNRS
ncbi:MAG: hypothetical protein VX225_02835, partial [Pseudomonadota bacterium]|nr:hypothetical protein [Pseudomonadota bacterium]